jgi:hypothetical protein
VGAADQPAELDTASAPNIQWEFSETHPRGHYFPDRPLRFAPTPSAAVATLSRGAREAGTPIDAVLSLQEALAKSPLAKESQLQELFPAMLSLVESEHAQETLAGSAEELLTPFLEQLVATAQLHSSDSQFSAEGSSSPQDLLGRLRGVATKLFQCEIHPTRWSFGEPQLASSWAENSTAFAAEFHGSKPLGELVLHRFSLLEPSQAEINVSAGAPPTGFAELHGLLTQRQAAEVSSLEQWPAQRYKSREVLELEVTKFYERNWSILEAKEQVCLCNLLQAEFQLSTFVPQQYNDFEEDWLEVASHHEIRSGHITFVARPGLKSAEGKLRVRAKVEVD